MDERDIMGRASLNLKYERKVRLFVKIKLNDIQGKYFFLLQGNKRLKTKIWKGHIQFKFIT